MKIFVDADACPVVHIVEKLAKKYEIPCKLLCDTNHVLRSDYSDVIVVGAGADAVDFKLISLLHCGDICVSQDYGVAAMALGKGCYAIHQSGRKQRHFQCLLTMIRQKILVILRNMKITLYQDLEIG